MLDWEFFQKVNHTSALLASVICNSLLCLCLYGAKKNQIGLYRHVLTVQCFVDVFAAVLLYLCSIRFVMVNGNFFAIFTGHWAYVDSLPIIGNYMEPKYLAMGTYPLTVATALMCVPLCFCFRYRQICWYVQ